MSTSDYPDVPLDLLSRDLGYESETPSSSEPNASDIWRKLLKGLSPTFKDAIWVLERSTELASFSCMPGVKMSKHSETMSVLMKRPEVHGVIRVMRKTKGDHALWCIFGEDGTGVTLRVGTPEVLFKTEGSLLNAETRNKDHPDGALGYTSFLSCKNLSKSKRLNIIDMVEMLL